MEQDTAMGGIHKFFNYIMPYKYENATKNNC